MITVFYAGKIHAQYISPWSMRREITPSETPELYNGAYLYFPNDAGTKKNWYRCDLTPVLDADVPPELKAWVLLLEL